MALLVSVRNTNPMGDVTVHHSEFPGGRLDVRAGAVIQVSPELAGRPPKDADLGAGLLAQVGNWAPVDEPATGTSGKTEAEGVGAK